MKRAAEQVPEPLKSALVDADEEWAEEVATAYLAGSDDDKAGMLAFVCSAGPAVVEELKQKRRNGTPTSGELADATGMPFSRSCPGCGHPAHGAGPEHGCPCGCGRVL